MGRRIVPPVKPVLPLPGFGQHIADYVGQPGESANFNPTKGVTKPVVQPKLKIGPRPTVGFGGSSIITIGTIGAGLDALYGAQMKEKSGRGSGGGRMLGRPRKAL